LARKEEGGLILSCLEWGSHCWGKAKSSEERGEAVSRQKAAGPWGSWENCYVNGSIPPLANIDARKVPRLRLQAEKVSFEFEGSRDIYRGKGKKTKERKYRFSWGKGNVTRKKGGHRTCSCGKVKGEDW